MSIQCKATRVGGICFACRHANQNTEDFEEEYVFCRFLDGKREWKSACEVHVKDAFLYEPFDGANSTWLINDDELEVEIKD